MNADEFTTLVRQVARGRGRRMSKAQLADRIGIHRQRLWDYEQGKIKTIPSAVADTLRAIAAESQKPQ